jgi:hypothetical protein
MACDRLQGRRCASEGRCCKNDPHDERDRFDKTTAGLLTSHSPFSGSASHERDGRIEIAQKGVVGDSSTALKHASSGTNFSWPFASRFEQSRGKALGSPCRAEFVK